MSHERLSAQDASFLHLETPTSPMHVGSLMLFEAAPFLDDTGRFRLDDVRAHVGRRLSAAPRARQRVMQVPLGSGLPVWVDDDRFDLATHVRLTALPRPGTEAQLLALAGRLLASRLDRRRPLWELWFVEGVQGDRVALVTKTHHAMVEGVTHDVVAALFDAGPTPAAPAGTGDPWEPAAAPSAASLLAESLVDRARQTTGVIGNLRAVTEPGAALGAAREVGRALRAVGSQEAPRVPFNGPLGPRRRVEVARVDLDAVRAVKRAFGCTVNDVVLAMVSAGLRSYLHRETDVDVERLVLKALVPVSVSDAGGQRVDAIVADLPVHEPDPVAALRSIHTSLVRLKAAGALSVGAITGLLRFAPPTLLSLAARLVPRQRAVNLVVTNVPGPASPRYCLGARLLEPFPYLGLAGHLGLAVAVVSYDSRLHVGLTADPELVPDVGLLAESLEKAAGDLIAEGGAGDG
jgi:diacylglycerol O-acyltransferase / wax synthase